jgi:DNA-binding XRE family transcriptional regulator
MTPVQSRGARGMLGWSQRHLGERAGGIHHNTVCSFEAGRYKDETTHRRLTKALNDAGVTFVEDTGVILNDGVVQLILAEPEACAQGYPGGSRDEDKEEKMSIWQLNDFMTHQGPNTKVTIFLPKVECMHYDDRTDTLTIYMANGALLPFANLRAEDRIRIEFLWTQTTTKKK